MPLPQHYPRRDRRYVAQLPALVSLNHRVIPAQSENISLNGILVSSEFLIPEGSVVELAVAVPLILLTGYGKVIRVRLHGFRKFRRCYCVGATASHDGTGFQSRLHILAATLLVF